MKRHKKGFTLTEVLIVIVIIGIILTIAIPSVMAIRRRINERLFETKKEEILVAAELYGKDKGIKTETTIYVYTLLGEKYIEKDIEHNAEGCTGENTENGCVINPVDDTSINDTPIVIKPSGASIVAIWNGNASSSESKELVAALKNTYCKNGKWTAYPDYTADNGTTVSYDFCCTKNGSSWATIPTGSTCLIKNDEVSGSGNYLWDSGIMWRLIGIYNLEGRETVKMVTDDTVTWEEDTNSNG